MKCYMSEDEMFTFELFSFYESTFPAGIQFEFNIVASCCQEKEIYNINRNDITWKKNPTKLPLSTSLVLS